MTQPKTFTVGQETRKVAGRELIICRSEPVNPEVSCGISMERERCPVSGES